MFTIAKIFGKSPFPSLQTHMHKVKECIDQIKDLLESLDKISEKKIASLSKEISLLESEADKKKMEIRSHLPKSLLLPISRGMILEILSLQDEIANKSKDIAILLSLKPLEFFAEFKDSFRNLFRSSFACFETTYLLIKELDPLLESSFGGKEAEKVRKIIEKIEEEEEETDQYQYQFLKKIYNFPNFSSPSSILLWLSLSREISSLADLCEKIGHRMYMLLHTK